MKFSAAVTLLQLVAILAAPAPKKPKDYDTSDFILSEGLRAVWTPGQGGIYDTCQRQQEIVTFNITKLSTPYPACGPFAAFRVCMKLNLPETRLGISKTCVKNDTEVRPPDFKEYDGLEWATASVGVALGRDWKNPYDLPASNQAVQCQIGCGDYLYFELVDGYKCRPTNLTRWPDYGSVPVTPENFSPVSRLVAECHSIPGWALVGTTVGSCTCSAVDQDCVWRVPVPSVPQEDRPSPSSSPDCCPPMSEECDAARIKLEEIDGYGNDVKIEDCADPTTVIDALNLNGYGCELAGEPGCKTIKCETLVTQEILDKLEFKTCPV